MRFDLYTPCTALQPYIKQFAIAESDEEHTYKVLPHPSLVIGFQYRGRLSYLHESGETKLSTFGITGLTDTYRIFKNEADTHTILLYFTETGAAHFFRIPLNELFSESLSLDHFIAKNQLEDLTEQLIRATSDRERIHRLEQFLLTQLQHTTADLLVETAVHRIYQSNGNVRLRQLSNELNTSVSVFEKRFRTRVGASPKKFASIVRFQSVLNSPHGHTTAERGYLSGYYDQSHFIKDFRQYTGETPEQYFKKLIPKNDFLQS